MKITDLPRVDRPREKLVAKGVANLKDKELIAILFRTGYKGKNVVELSDEVLKKHELKRLLQLNFDELIAVKGIDSSKACTLLAAFELTRRAMNVFDTQLPTIQSSSDALAHLVELRGHKKEHFVVLYMNTRNQLIHKEVVSIGIVNASMVHPREVFEPAVRHLAVQIVIAHNHPSGDLTPSGADIEVTERLVEAGKIMGIELVDHVIVSKTGYFSFVEKGLM